MMDKNSVIIDDELLTVTEQDHIKTCFTNPFFPWYIGENLDSTNPVYIENHFKKLTNNIFEYTQFVHTFVQDSTEVSSAVAVPLTVFNRAKEKYQLNDDLLRIKANFCTKIHIDQIDAHHTPHIDDNDHHWTMIYYVNDSDGDLFLFDEVVPMYKELTTISSITVKQRVTPKQGRCVIFDGHRLHAGMHPTKHNYRMVINFNIKKA